ncbi:MAG TPA: aminoacyl-tRNA hydrolase [Acidimicrobiia bacterium]
MRVGRGGAEPADHLLVVGLRNPGADYEGTRHNVGGETVRSIAAGSSFKRAPKRILAEVVETDLEARPAVLALPTTFMNESGGPVSALVDYYRVDMSRLVLVHDDIDLPFGKLRFHSGRGAGGHNGVASVMRSLGSRDVWRLKIGVGRPPGRMDPADFVLHRFTPAERSDVDLMVGEAADTVRRFAAAGGEEAKRYAGEATRRLGIVDEG